MRQLKKVAKIYNGEKIYRAEAVNDYFEKQINWIDRKCI